MLIWAHLCILIPKKYILNLGEGLAQGIDDVKLTAEAAYSTNFTERENKFCLTLHYNVNNSYLFVTEVKIYQFISKDSELFPYALCSGNI